MQARGPGAKLIGAEGDGIGASVCVDEWMKGRSAGSACGAKADRRRNRHSKGGEWYRVEKAVADQVLDSTLFVAAADRRFELSDVYAFASPRVEQSHAQNSGRVVTRSELTPTRR